MGCYVWLAVVVNAHINQLQHYMHNITSGAQYPGVPRGEMDDHLVSRLFYTKSWYSSP